MAKIISPLSLFWHIKIKIGDIRNYLFLHFTTENDIMPKIMQGWKLPANAEILPRSFLLTHTQEVAILLPAFIIMKISRKIIIIDIYSY